MIDKTMFLSVSDVLTRPRSCVSMSWPKFTMVLGSLDQTNITRSLTTIQARETMVRLGWTSSSDSTIGIFVPVASITSCLWPGWMESMMLGKTSDDIDMTALLSILAMASARRGLISAG